MPAQPFRPKDHIEGNPIGLPRDAVTKLIPDLDKHVASLFVLYHQYQKHHWLVEGPQFHDLHLFLNQSYTQVLNQIDLLAERITALGGIPTCSPVEFTKIAYITHEPEGTYRVRQMLELDLHHEGEIAKHLRHTVSTARDIDPGTEHLVKQILFQTEDRAHHLSHFLGEDSLEIGLTTGETAPAKAGKAHAKASV